MRKYHFLYRNECYIVCLYAILVLGYSDMITVLLKDLHFLQQLITFVQLLCMLAFA